MAQKYGSQFLTGFLGAAFGVAIHFVSTACVVIHTVPVVPVLICSVIAGILHALIYVGIHARLKLQPSTRSAIASATILVAIGVVISLFVGTFPGWSIWSIVLPALLVGLIAYLTVYFSQF